MIERVDEQQARPAVGWASGPLGAVQAIDREITRQTARRARKVAEFAATRPASADRQPGQSGCMSAERRAARPEVLADVSEWAAQELMIALSIGLKAAENLLTRSLTLVHRLPRTLVALESGALHLGHLYLMLEKVAPVADRTVRERLERDLLAWIAAREVTTPAQLGAKIRRELLARNVRSAARDLEAALRRRGVYVQPDRVDGMAVLMALLTVPEAAALMDALGRYADAIEDDPAVGAPRTRGQKMADCLLDLVLRPGETDLPAVRAQLTLVAPVATMVGGDQPGENDGQPVSAEIVRALARGLGLLPDAPPDALDAPDAPDAATQPRRRPRPATLPTPRPMWRWWRPTNGGGPRSRRVPCAATGVARSPRPRRSSNGSGPRRRPGTVTGPTTQTSPPSRPRSLRPSRCRLTLLLPRRHRATRSRRGGCGLTRPSTRPAGCCWNSSAGSAVPAAPWISR